MADIYNSETRRYNISMVKGKNTKPELIVRKFLHENGYRYRLHNKDLLGKSDIKLTKYNTLIFINGCFWHGHSNCKKSNLPQTRTEWWKNKIETTKKRDLTNYKRLLKLGWKVLIIWECELKSNSLENTFRNMIWEIKT